MTNLKFELFKNEKAPENEYQPKIGAKMAKIFLGDGFYNTVVQEDNFGEYIVVPNYLYKTFFTNRPKDAVETAKNGDGDVLVGGPFKTMSMHYYLDRTVGEQFREKFLNGFKDTEFQTVIFMQGTFGGLYLIKRDDGEYTLESPINIKSDTDIAIFDSDEEAQKVIDSIYDKTEELIRNNDENIYNCNYIYFYIIGESEETGEIKISKRFKVAQIIKDQFFKR